jgi:hypothetical protein
MSSNVVQLVKPPPMVAIVIAGKENGFDCPTIEGFVTEAYPRANEDEIYAAVQAAVCHFRDQGAALEWIAEAIRRRKTAPAAG